MRLQVAKHSMFLHANNEDSDQTGQMFRLIRVFAGRTGHSVGFVVRWLNLFSFPLLYIHLFNDNLIENIHCVLNQFEDCA